MSKLWRSVQDTDRTTLRIALVYVASVMNEQ